MASPARSLSVRQRRRGARRLRLRRLPARATAAAIVGLGLVGALALLLVPRGPTPAALVIASRQALAAGNAPGARALAARAVARDRRLAIGEALLARAALAEDDAIAADLALRRAQDAGLDPARLHHLRAEALVLEGDADGARAEAAQAIAPYRGYAARIAARAQALGGDPAGAQAALRSLVAAHPGDGPAWLDLARLSYGMGQPAAAGAATGRTLSLMPRDAGALTLAGTLARAQHGEAAAAPWFDRALRASPTYFPALIEAAASQGELGRYRAMLALTRRALAIRPGSAKPLYLQAVIAARGGRAAMAQELMARTAGALDTAPGAMLLAGALAYGDGRYQEAVTRWQALADARPGLAPVRYLFAEALVAAGDPAGGLEALTPLAMRPDASRKTLLLAANAAVQAGDAAAATQLARRAAQAPAAGDDGFVEAGDLAGIAAKTGAVDR